MTAKGDLTTGTSLQVLLAISQAFVEVHGGTITAVSEGHGKGTAVRFELAIRQLHKRRILKDAD